MAAETDPKLDHDGFLTEMTDWSREHAAKLG